MNMASDDGRRWGSGVGCRRAEVGGWTLVAARGPCDVRRWHGKGLAPLSAWVRTAILRAMRGVLLLAALLTLLPLAPVVVTAADSATLLAEALRLKEQYRDAEALARLETLLAEDAAHGPALLQAAHLHFRLGWLYSEGEERRRRFFLADEMARRALAAAPDNAAARLMAVVARGKIASYLSSAEQVRIAREISAELTSLARLLPPDDVDLLHVAAWLHFKVGKVSAVERLLAGVFFGGLPEGLYVDTAMATMRRLIELRPESPVYPYDLGVFYQRLGQPGQARPWFEKVAAMAGKTPEEEVYQRWAKRKLAQIGG